MSDLDKEEREILTALETGSLKQSFDAKETSVRHQAYAAAEIRRRKNRFSELGDKVTAAYMDVPERDGLAEIDAVTSEVRNTDCANGK